MKALNIRVKIGSKMSGYIKKRFFRIQFGDINFYKFLLSIGLKSAKSKTLGALDIPDDYFTDFLRGCIDGDGNIRIARHPESKYPQLQIRLISASLDFLKWIKDEIIKNVQIKGGWIEEKNEKSYYVLAYGKEDSIKILRFMYYDNVNFYLKRKYTLVKKFLRM